MLKINKLQISQMISWKKQRRTQIKLNQIMWTLGGVNNSRWVFNSVNEINTLDFNDFNNSKLIRTNLTTKAVYCRFTTEYMKCNWHVVTRSVVELYVESKRKNVLIRQIFVLDFRSIIVSYLDKGIPSASTAKLAARDIRRCFDNLDVPSR